MCRLIRLILTLPVSTATTERAFSAIKINKTRRQNKMEDDFFKKLPGTLYRKRECNEGHDIFNYRCLPYDEESRREI
jgi:hypothetical protein